jgi:uncharacterized protein YbjT (DUF2867 family)
VSTDDTKATGNGTFTVLVTGATGKVGRNVVDLLLEAGASVRTMTRNPDTADLPAEADVRFGDFGDPGTFADALAGVDKVFLFPDPAGAGKFVQAARIAGVRHVVLLSSMSVLVPEPEANPISNMHLGVERAIEDSGLDWTFVRPTAFAANTLAWGEEIRSGEIRLPYAEATVAPVHESDIARVAVQALLTEGHNGAAYAVTGPESLTQRRQVELISAGSGRKVVVTDLTGDDARAQLAERYGAPWLVDTVLGSLVESVGVVAETTDQVERVTGRPPLAFADWVTDNRDHFGG